MIIESKLAYTIKEAVVATGISKSSLYEDIAAGKIATKKRGATTLILRDELARFLADLPDARAA